MPYIEHLGMDSFYVQEFPFPRGPFSSFMLLFDFRGVG